MHHNKLEDEESGKHAIVAHYNITKGGVDMIDEKCSKSICRRRTQRWPMAIFFRILDISCANSYIIHQSYKNNLQINAS